MTESLFKEYVWKKKKNGLPLTCPCASKSSPEMELGVHYPHHPQALYLALIQQNPQTSFS